MGSEQDKEKEIQQKYLEMQLIEQQLQKLQKQMEAMEEQVQEIDKIIDDIKDLETVEEGSEILVPVSNGIFVKAKIGNPKTVYMNVGSNVNVKKGISHALKLMEKQAEEIKEMRTNFAAAIERFMERAAELEKEMKSIVGED